MYIRKQSVFRSKFFVDLKSKKILVTGGAGFLGHHVVQKLISRGVPEGNIFVPRSSDYDLRKRGDCEKVVIGRDVVVHLAAKVGGIGYNQAKPGELFYDNVSMGAHMLDVAYRAGCEKILMLATVCSYPKFAPVPFKEKDLWNGYPEETNAPYGLAKKSLIVGAQAYRKQYCFNAITLLPVNLYGPRDSFDILKSHVIPALIKKVYDAKKEGSKSINVWGTGRATREFLYVEDAAEGIVFALEKYDKLDPVNLGSGREISIKDLVELIAKMMDFSGEILWDNTKPDGQPRRMLDVTRAEREFGFRAKTNFSEGLKKTIDWYVESQKGVLGLGMDASKQAAATKTKPEKTPQERGFFAENIKTVEACRVCGNKNLEPILSLGNIYVSDFLGLEDEGSAMIAPLDLVLCDADRGGCGLLQLKHTVSHESLYRNYWYRSGINKTMTDELAGITKAARKIVSLKDGDSVIDIGSNDGTLLRSYDADKLSTVGFEPARNIVEKYGRKGITKVINNFFNYPEWEKEFGRQKAKIITAIAMFYDLEEPNTFVGDVKKCLDDDGVFIIQTSYLPYVIERNAFDGICHEHLEIYSLFSLEGLLGRHGLEVFDLELRDINEGSIRVYVRHMGGGKSIRVPDEAGARVKEMRQKEKLMRLHGGKIYQNFVSKIEDLKNKAVGFIKSEVASGKKVYVYGASTKGNTLLQYYGLDVNMIPAAAERNPDKWGRRTVGTNIPIISEEQARKDKPDYFFVLPWHFIKEFVEREKEYLKGGGKFIVPLPEFKIIGGEDVQ